MICELLVMIQLTRKLWARGRMARGLALGMWAAFAVGVRYVLAAVELLPRPVVLALPVIGLTCAAVTVVRTVRRRRPGVAVLPDSD